MPSPFDQLESQEASPFSALEEQETAEAVPTERVIPDWMRGGNTPSFVTPGGLVNIPVSTLTEAAKAIPDKSPLQSVGISPENILPGTAVPKPLWPLTVPASAAAKTVVGVGTALTTPKGLMELGALFTPAAPLVSAKWIFDMVKGAGESGKDLLGRLRKLVSEPKSFTNEDIQALGDDVVSFAAQAGGVKGLASHQLGNLRTWNQRRMAQLVNPETGQKPFAELEQAEAAPSESKIVAEAAKVLPAAAAEVEKGTSNAPQERIQPENNLGEYPRNDEVRPPPEAGGGGSPGERPPEPPREGGAGAAPGQTGVLLDRSSEAVKEPWQMTKDEFAKQPEPDYPATYKIELDAVASGQKPAFYGFLPLNQPWAKDVYNFAKSLGLKIRKGPRKTDYIITQESRAARGDAIYAHVEDAIRDPRLEDDVLWHDRFSKLLGYGPEFEGKITAISGPKALENKRLHAYYVAKAVREGKPVPTEVLSDYPTLKKSEPTPPVTESAPQESAPEGVAPQGALATGGGVPPTPPVLPGISEPTAPAEKVQVPVAGVETLGTSSEAAPGAQHGIAERVRQRIAAEGKAAPVLPGQGVAPDVAIARGEELNAQNPGLAEKILADFEAQVSAAGGDLAKVGISEQLFTVTRARGRQLYKSLLDAEQQYGPNSPEYKAAWNTYSDWTARTKPMHTSWARSGQAQQGEVDVDTGTFTGLNQISLDATEKGLPDASIPKAKIVAARSSNAEKAAAQAVFDAHRRIAVAAAEAERKGLVAEVKEKAARAQPEIEAKQKALDAARKVTAKAAERLTEAEKKAQVAKSAAEKKAAEAERRLAQKEADKQSIRVRRAAADLAKSESKAIADPIGTVWKKAKEIIERQPPDKGMIEPSDLVNQIATELNMPTKRVINTLSQDKRAKYLMDEAWKKQLIARNLRTQAKVWAATRNIEPYKRALAKIPRVMFSLKVGLHGTVALGTHVPMVAFQPRFWAAYVKDFGKMYRMVGQPAYHQMQMNDLVRRPNWTAARRGGLVNDPFQFEDYNSPQTTVSFGRLTGMGNRGYSVLKVIRQDMFDQHFDRLPDRLKKIPEVAAEIANSVNHATGVVKGRAPTGTNIGLFAPRLEASRVMWLLGDPVKSADIFLRWDKATEAEKWFAKQTLRERAWVLGTMSGLLALNQGFLKAVDSDQEINWGNPMKSDWLKFKVAGMNVGYGNAMISMARLPPRLAMAVARESGKLQNVVFEDEEWYKILGSYARSQASPFAGATLDLALGRDYAERPLPRALFGTIEGKMNIPKRLRAQGITEPYSWTEYGAKTAAFIPLQEGLVEGWQAIEDVWNGMGVAEEEQKKLTKALAIISLMAGTGARVTEDVQY